MHARDVCALTREGGGSFGGRWHHRGGRSIANTGS